MDLQDLHRELVTKQHRFLYIFTGDDWKVQQIYIQQIAQMNNLDVSHADAVEDILGTIGSNHLIFKNKCFVIKDDESILKSGIQRLCNRLETSDDVVVLIYHKIDKRSNFYKVNSESIVEFNGLPKDMLVNHIQKEINLNQYNAEYLADICNCNYGKCLLEIDKIKQCMKATYAEDMPNNTFEMLLFDGTISIPPSDAIFDFVDAVMQRNVSKSFKLEQECIDYGESQMVMLTNLYNSMKYTLQVQTCPKGDIEKITGLSKWQINNARKHLNKYRAGELVYAIRFIAKIIQGVKKGIYNENTMVDYVLVNII